MIIKRLKLIGFIALMGVISLLDLNIVHAQDYKNGIGIRGGNNSGITFKHFIKETAAIEAIVNPYQHGLNLTLLYEKHAYAFKTKEFRWFYGLGGHVGVYNGYYYGTRFYNNQYDPYYNYNRNYVTLGIDGIIGLEYKITEIPFTIGIDFKPYVDILYFSENYLDAALSVRYYW